MTCGPAAIIGVDKGTLSTGIQADVTIIDPDAEYQIDVNKFISKSRNCPYHGWVVKGKVEKTIVGGAEMGFAPVATDGDVAECVLTVV